MSFLTDSLTQPLGRFRGSNYDITNRCNLRCEGCLFFAGDDYLDHVDDGDAAAWERLFASEAARGINFAYLAGAEPALAPEILRAAHRHIPHGVIFTNGTVRIAPDIAYRIHVSIWGGAKTAKELRGANTNVKAFRNFASDPRAIFVMTLNALNLDEAEEVAADCERNGARLTFSMYTPTERYNEQLALDDAQAVRDEFFRFSSAERNLSFDAATLARARGVVHELVDRFPGTVIVSKSYFDWLCQAEQLYRLDDTGVAIDCGNRLTQDHRHYGADRMPSKGKCCSPNLDCAECRAYAMSLGSYISRRPDKDAIDSRQRWREAVETWRDLFVLSDADREASLALLDRVAA